MTQNVINNLFMLANAGVALLDMSLVNVNQVVATSGENDLYTVPAGRRALISNFYVNSQGSVSATPHFKNSGTYYPGGANATSLTAGTPQNLMLLLPLILDAGETLSVLLSSATSVNCWPQIVEFSNKSPVKSIKFLNLQSGNNLLYTCPAGKTACCLDPYLNFGGASATSEGSITASGTIYFQFVPNGQSAGTGFRISNNINTSSGINASSVTRAPSFGPGDSLYVNSTASSNVVAFVNIVEIPF